MKIYNYHPGTGMFLGEGVADESPLEPGVFLIPANATASPPPAAGDGQYAKYENESWELVTITVVMPETEPEPTLAQIEQAYLVGIQRFLDASAKTKGYDNIVSACSYAAAPNAFQAEGLAFLAWRAEVWTYCYAELAKIKAGTRPVPTLTEILAEFPASP